MTDEILSPVPEQAETRVSDWRDNAQYASFYARMGAFLVDFVVLMLPLTVVLMPFYAVIWGAPNFSQQQLDVMVQSQGQEILPMLLDQERLSRMFKEYVIFGFACGVVWLGFWYHFSATPGKLLFRIRIVDEETGRPPSWKQYITRYLGFLPSGGLLGLGFFWLQWNKRAKAWHDMMAGTVVVKNRSLPLELQQATLKTEKP